MIITKLVGGHSNQLFQYAVGRRLADLHKTELLLDLTWYENLDGIDTPRQYELACYPLKAKIADMNKLKLNGANGLRSKLGRLRNRQELKVYKEDGLGFDSNVLTLPDNSYLDGYWQNEKYFLDIRPKLLRELEPTTPLLKANNVLIELMKSTESVWMHVRRGDYITSKHTNAFHGVKGAEYYQKALKALLKKLPRSRQGHIEIFICSNDIPWCKKNLRFDYPIHFVENELGSEDMRVIKHCKHDIIANSSFSWWGAWLNDNPEKIVIAPKVWFQDKKSNAETDIVPKNWIRL